MRLDFNRFITCFKLQEARCNLAIIKWCIIRLMKANILLNHENKWVALSKDRDKVLFASKSLESLFKKLDKVKNKDVILHYVPPFDGYLSL